RKAAVARIESACQKATSERCDVITLYQGGEYHLYQYKRYTDVRLVFAPEQQIAFYGGDPDNFTYPRHDLDLCLFRAYENGRPAKPAAFLAWGTQGAQEGDLVFVSGNPGSTSRLLTTAQLISLRDHGVPDSIAALEARRGALLAYAAMGKEQERRALAQIFGIENSLKAFRGRLAALRDQAAMARQAEAEQALRRKVEADPALKASVGAAWDAIAQATLKAESKKNELRYATFKRPRLFNIAGTLVQYAAEMRKPNEQRLEEFADSNLPALMNTLYSPAPIYLDLEEKLLTAHLEAAATSLGSEHPFVKAALAGATPAEAARRAVAGTALRDVAARKALTAGGTSAITASTDTMIDLARRIDPLVRATRQWYEEEVDAAIVRASQEIAQARFKLLGKTVPPDATFTLRLNYGTIKGFPMEGSQAPAFTTFFGLYDRAAGFNNRAPWNLPQRFRERMNRLDLATPLNFVTTNDTIGGSSGSPVVDREGRFVGLVFDGNIHSLAWDYFYTDERGRTVAVDARAILEALRKLYDADAVALEILGTPAPGAAK
ncbi:MAG: S46 family peptidase, partial [Vicinamibacteria bacterium]|nr:S46 family peptidase [Vicinamibacteria bacterium]